MSKLSFAALRAANVSRAPRWHTSAAGMNEWTIGDWFMAMAGEVGEGADELIPLMYISLVGKLGSLGNMAKKYRRVQEGIANKAADPDRHINQENAIRKMFEELADVQIYLDLFALRLREALNTGEDVGDHVEQKFNKTSELYGFPERLIDGKFVLIDSKDFVFDPPGKIGKSKALAEKVTRQSEEFNALAYLVTTFKNLPPIVDDDYPMMRDRYEGALHRFISALKANDRISLEPCVEEEEEITPKNVLKDLERVIKKIDEGLDGEKVGWNTEINKIAYYLAQNLGSIRDAILRRSDGNPEDTREILWRLRQDPTGNWSNLLSVTVDDDFGCHLNLTAEMAAEILKKRLKKLYPSIRLVIS